MKWKNGFVIQYDNAFAEVIENWKCKSVVIKIKIGKPTDVYNILKEQVEQFNQDFMNDKFVRGLSFEVFFQYNGKSYTSKEVADMVDLKKHFQGILYPNAVQEKENLDIEQLKKELRALLDHSKHLCIATILRKIEENLTNDKYDRIKWVDINSNIGAISTELLQAALVQSTESLINSIQS
ncbi:MAG: hypothetical protein EAZ95_14690 [Bacteroidetes bacterium]|nr:MAG: hypothetical protein EAZ95_14690 [Bacteroidota bacterium]